MPTPPDGSRAGERLRSDAGSSVLVRTTVPDCQLGFFAAPLFTDALGLRFHGLRFRVEAFQFEFLEDQGFRAEGSVLQVYET